MSNSELGHHANRAYFDHDGNLHLNGASIHTDESGTAISGTELANAADGLGVALSSLAATAAEINRSADVSARLVAAGASLTLTEASHADKIIKLDTAAGSAITLPAATGSGARFIFIVTTKPTSNQHRISVVGNDEFVGSVNILDVDGSAQAAFAALDAADNDQLDLNGTTKGGQVGDWLEIVDIAADNWHVRGQCVCPAGSNPATPFTTGQVT